MSPGGLTVHFIGGVPEQSLSRGSELWEGPTPEPVMPVGLEKDQLLVSKWMEIVGGTDIVFVISVITSPPLYNRGWYFIEQAN